MAVGILISLPEGLEAFLVIVIVVALLRQVEQKTARAGVLIAGLLAVTSSALFSSSLIVSIDGRLRGFLEMSASLIGLVAITWLVGWIQAKIGEAESLKSDRENPVFTGLGLTIIFILSFVVVFREFVEVTAFFVDVASSTNGAEFLPGVIIGLILGAGLAVLGYWFLTSLSPKSLYLVSGISLILAAAALGAHGISNLGDLGFLSRSLTKVVWDINWLMPQNSLPSRFLHAFTGYKAAPGILMVLFYLSYLLVFGFRFFIGYERSLEDNSEDTLLNNPDARIK